MRRLRSGGRGAALRARDDGGEVVLGHRPHQRADVVLVIVVLVLVDLGDGDGGELQLLLEVAAGVPHHHGARAVVVVVGRVLVLERREVGDAAVGVPLLERAAEGGDDGGALADLARERVVEDVLEIVVAHVVDGEGRRGRGEDLLPHLGVAGAREGASAP